MAKLLIIEDQIEMAKLIQAQMEKLNPLFSDENDYFICSGGTDLNVCSFSEVQTLQLTDPTFKGKKERILQLIQAFLREYSKDEKILILIDVLLNSLSISAPTYERYVADAEYSADLYAYLIRVENGELDNLGVNRQNIFHIIYSRSDKSVQIVKEALKDIFENQKGSDRSYFPQESTLLKNISWCRNCCDETDDHNNVDTKSGYAAAPLVFPPSYIKFIKRIE